DLPGLSPSSDPCPVLITRNLASLWTLEPGATLSVRAALAGSQSALPAVACRVIGIADSLFATADEYDVLTTLAGMQAVNGGSIADDADLVLVASRPEAGSAAAV